MNDGASMAGIASRNRGSRIDLAPGPLARGLVTRALEPADSVQQSCVPVVVAPEQPESQRWHQQDHRDGARQPDRPPVGQCEQEHRGGWEYRLTGGKAESRDADGAPAAVPRKVAGHRHRRRLAQQALAGDAQKEDRKDEQHHATGERKRETGGRDQDAQRQGVVAQVKAIDDPSHPDYQDAAGQRADRIDGSEVAVTQCEGCPDLATVHGNVEGLSEGRGKGQQEAEPEKPCMGEDERQVPHAGPIPSCASAGSTR